MAAVQETIDQVRAIDVDQYKYGFETEIESDKVAPGLNEDVIRLISAKKNEPEWMLEWRLEAYRRWLTMEEPTWARVDYPKIDFNSISYYSAPKSASGPKSLSEVDPELLKTYEKLGIPIYDMVTAGTFEGGDFNVIEDGVVLIGCGGARTNEEGARQVKEWFDKEGWETRLAFIDEYYVHIDLMVVPIAPKLTAVCLDCTDPAIVTWLKDKGHDIVNVPFQDTMALGCNFMSLGKDRVIAPTTSRVLVEQLKARGFEVATVDTAEISKTGGGIHCMAQALRREAA